MSTVRGDCSNHGSFYGPECSLCVCAAARAEIDLIRLSYDRYRELTCSNLAETAWKKENTRLQAECAALRKELWTMEFNHYETSFGSLEAYLYFRAGQEKKEGKYE